MLRLGIDPEKPYQATFICQDGLCCCNMTLISFRLFRKNLGNLRDFFGQMVYRPPLAKNFRYAYVFSRVTSVNADMFLHFQNREFTNIAKICKKTSSLRMNTSSVFTYRCLWEDVQVATHSLLSVVILVTPLQRNSYKMNFSTNKDKTIRLRNIGELYHTPA